MWHLSGQSVLCHRGTLPQGVPRPHVTPAAHPVQLGPSTAVLLFPLQLLHLQESHSPPGEMWIRNLFTSALLNYWCMKHISKGTPTDVHWTQPSMHGGVTKPARSARYSWKAVARRTRTRPALGPCWCQESSPVPRRCHHQLGPAADRHHQGSLKLWVDTGPQGPTYQRPADWTPSPASAHQDTHSPSTADHYKGLQQAMLPVMSLERGTGAGYGPQEAILFLVQLE